MLQKFTLLYILFSLTFSCVPAKKYNELLEREKSLIALAVAHTIQCPYCIDAYTQDTMEKGCDEAQLMEAVHVAASIRGGATLVHGVQMMNKYKELSM